MLMGKHDFFIGSTNSDGGTQLKKAHGLTENFYDRMFKRLEDRDVYSIIPLLLRPKSQGYVTIRSRNPFDYPLIYPNYFAVCRKFCIY